MLKFSHLYHILKIFRHCQVSKFTSKKNKMNYINKINVLSDIELRIISLVISWDDCKLIIQLWLYVNYKLCKLFQICLQRPLYFLNVPNYNWLPYNDSFILINIGLNGKINFPSTELACKSNTDFDIDCYKIWSSMLDLVSILSLTFDICRLPEQLANRFYDDRVTRHFFCHLVHTSSERCWILLQPSSLLSSLLSVLPDSSGGGIRTLFFIVNRVDRLIGLRPFPSLGSSTASGCEIIIASTSAIKGERASLRLFPCVLSRENRFSLLIIFVALIVHSCE